MNIKQKVTAYLIVGVSLIGIGGLSFAPAVQAVERCAGVDVAILKCDEKYDNKGSIEKNGIWSLLLTVINILTAGIGVVALGGIVYGSILYSSAGGNTEQVKKAIGIIRNVIIGLIAFVAMYALLQFLIPGGVFSG